MGLCLLESLGKKCRIETPVASALINLASALKKADYRLHGRNLSAFGLNRMSITQICAYLKNGENDE